MLDLGDRKIPTTLHQLHEQIVQRVDIEIEGLASIMREVDKHGRERRYKQGLEFPTTLRFGMVCERLGLDDPELPEILTRSHMRVLQELVGYLPHHVEVLQGLRAAGMRTAVCSNFSHTPTGVAVVEAAGLGDVFDAIAISEETEFRKPRPEIFEETFRRIDVAAPDVVHVGDNLDADVHGASALGARTVWVTRRVTDPDKVLESHKGRQPDFVISDLSELPAVLELRTTSS